MLLHTIILSKLEFNAFNFKEAERLAQKAVGLSAKNKYYLELYADVLSLNKKPKEAIKILRTIKRVI